MASASSRGMMRAGVAMEAIRRTARGGRRRVSRGGLTLVRFLVRYCVAQAHTLNRMKSMR